VTFFAEALVGLFLFSFDLPSTLTILLGKKIQLRHNYAKQQVTV
jgi:hypothetical protein